MDLSSLTTEMTSLDYIQHFYALEEGMKTKILQEQHYLYKGINAQLIAGINQQLYIKQCRNVRSNIYIRANIALINVQEEKDPICLHFKHRETGEHFMHKTQVIIAATGYRHLVPGFLEPLFNLIRWNKEGLYDPDKYYSVDQWQTIFVQNAELYIHGFNSADLGIGPYRNAVIINTILKRTHFKLETGSAFQHF